MRSTVLRDWAAVAVTIAAVLASTLSASAARADLPAVPAAPVGVPVHVAGEQAQQRLAIKGMYFKPTNEKVGVEKKGLFCTGDDEIRYAQKLGSAVMQGAGRIVRSEFEAAGYSLAQESAFGSPDAAAAVEYLVAATLADVRMEICYNDRSAVGGIWLKVNWELFSPRERRVVYHAALESRFETKEKMRMSDFFESAVRSAARNLLADPAFVAQATQRAQSGASKELDALAIATRVAGGPGTQARMPELQSSVVTIFSGIGSGSGFYISADGYLLTNQHVVGDAKFVKIKLASGKELLGEVVRTTVEHDVALVKTEAVALAPIPLDEAEAKTGDEVYALGSPFGDAYSQSVTHGVVSGMREIDKVRWLQSDATVAPGSSGGPLIDAAGGVVGLARSGVRGANINLFVPIADAMSSLKIVFR